MVGAQRFDFRGFFGAADGGDDGAADRFGDLHRDAADAGAAGLDQDRFARLQLRVIEQHVLDGGISDADAGGVLQRHAIGDFNHQPRRMVGDVLRPAVDVKTANAEDVFAKIVAASQALAAVPQV